ncbi:MAG: hypothetical protein WAO30_09885 [Thermacetogeniaceae bacterium]|nr:hypothetical protein [Syntrophomonadaceae bacterium]
MSDWARSAGAEGWRMFGSLKPEVNIKSQSLFGLAFFILKRFPGSRNVA